MKEGEEEKKGGGGIFSSLLHGVVGKGNALKGSFVVALVFGLVGGPLPNCPKHLK